MRRHTIRPLIVLLALTVLAGTAPAVATELEVKEQAPAKTEQKAKPKSAPPQQPAAQQPQRAAAGAQPAKPDTAAKPGATKAEASVNTLEDIYAAVPVPQKPKADKPAGENGASTDAKVEWRAVEKPEKP